MLRRNSTGSFPAALAISSTKHSAKYPLCEHPTERQNPTGILLSVITYSTSRFGTSYFRVESPSTEDSSMPFFTEPGKNRDIIDGPTTRFFHATTLPLPSSPASIFTNTAG